MAQESYADYSIIHKYFQQEKLHEEELQRYKDQILELSKKLERVTEEAENAKAKLRQTTEENESLQGSTSDKESEIHRLNTTITNLNKKIASITRGR